MGRRIFQELGPEKAPALAETAAIVRWRDAYTEDGAVPAQVIIQMVSEALATASPALGRDYVDQLVDLGVT